MKKRPLFWGIFACPPPALSWALTCAPFILLAGAYFAGSDIRHAVNPDDKLLPEFGRMFQAMKTMAFTVDGRTGRYLFWSDTLASLSRIGMGLALSASVGLFLGINIGLLPGVRRLTSNFLTFCSNTPPLAILPIIFILFGIEELSKVMLIFIGTLPGIARDIAGTVRGIPQEQTSKALTLGASQFGLAYRVILPQVFPRLLENVRLSLGPAWLFLIASEAIASTDGLGYRIFLVRRYLSMDVIIPYVLWITFLAFVMDFALRQWMAIRHPWYNGGSK